MLTRHAYQGLVWIDLASPTPAEVRGLMDQYDLHPRLAEELLKPSSRPRAERFDNCLYLILNFPTVSGRSAAHAQEIDFILGKDFIITTHYEDVDPLFKFSKIFEANALIGRGDATNRSGYVFFTMLRNIYTSLDGELESVALALTRIEASIFAGRERAMVSELSRTARILLSFNQALAPHREMLQSLEAAGVRLFGQSFTYYLREAIGDFHRVASALQSERDMLTELRATNDSLLSAKQNETTKNLTLMAFITLPLTVVASIFGMNVEHTPLVGLPHDFWFVIAVMFILSISLIGILKLKRWL